MAHEEGEDFPHPILDKIVEAEQNGDETIPMSEVEQAFEDADDEETLEHVKDSLDEKYEYEGFVDKDKSLRKRLRDKLREMKNVW